MTQQRAWRGSRVVKQVVELDQPDVAAAQIKTDELAKNEKDSGKGDGKDIEDGGGKTKQ
jgi:hypothetical protein